MKWPKLLLLPFLCGAMYLIDWNHGIRYVPIGDSYSIGEGVKADENWPALLTEHLRKSGIKIDMPINPSRTGWTTQDALEKELPKATAARADYISIQIGVNDWVQGVSVDEFQTRLARLIEKTEEALGRRDRIFLVNIPDFSVTPTGKLMGDPNTCSRGIATFNEAIAEEASKRGIPLVDVFKLSQEMGQNPKLLAADGLHPSAEEYQEWEREIFPKVRSQLLK